MAKASIQFPDEVRDWLHEKGVDPDEESITEVHAPLPRSEEKYREFIMVSVHLDELDFRNHRYNPREPDKKKINSLAASIQSLGLLSPLTCAYLPDDVKDSEDREDEDVILLDGRHRYEALQRIASDAPDWARDTPIDLKIYLNLSRSDLYVLATYLNRTRESLKKGEYYRFVVEIYRGKKQELEGEEGRQFTEEEIFDKISSRQLTDRNFDLSVGRIVGLTAFNESNRGSWYPYVSSGQSEKVPDDDVDGYCPLTAGNMAQFLRYLCNSGPYDDRGEKRAIEMENVIELGRIFSDVGILDSVPSRTKSTGPSMACKHWPLKSFGSLLGDSSIFDDVDHPLSAPSQDWARIRKLCRVYLEEMEEQADYVNQLKETNRTDEQNLELLRKAWSYQTQMNLIKPKLRDVFEESSVEVTWPDS